MKSSARGKHTSAVEILNVSAFGIWLLADDREYFAAFEHFPWFKEAKIADILDVERPHAGHLFWPRLDVDLAVGSLEEPEKYPKVAKAAKRKG